MTVPRSDTQLLRREGVTISVSLTQRAPVQGIKTHLPANYLQHPAPLAKINRTIAPVTIFLEDVEVSVAHSVGSTPPYLSGTCCRCSLLVLTTGRIYQLMVPTLQVFLDAHIKKFEENILFLLMADAKQQNTNIRQFDKVE